ncbi:bifunctional diguanylate cyclase/phosphodiesterase [Labrenzia sp. R4_1]|uniref:putative bifunctional diguanylate cyclase/phosphodiesterase n=1 Tax=Labrenzia sp. R4_1 TaxID=2821106 RepID=UPI001ADD5D0B|nr:bifunctional diguanylate cyclase/phosphodiesterase [Labrenzia sp. R4_1]
MRIRGWLTGLIIFLLAPSLLFASLWFYGNFESVRAIDRSLKGVGLLQALGPLTEEKSRGIPSLKIPDDYRNQLIRFGGPDYADYLDTQLTEFATEEDVSKSLRHARSLALSIAALAKISSSSPYETTKLPHLLTEILPSVIIETSKMRENAELLSTKDTINVWDKMMVPVQGGQFKVAADGAARDTVLLFTDLVGPAADDLRLTARQYREANVAFQTQGAKFLTSTIQAETGTDIVAEPVITAEPMLIEATYTLWQETLDYLRAALIEEKQDTLQAVSLAGAVATAVIFIAFGIGAVLVRALADRTQKEFEKLGFHDPLTGLPNRRALLEALRTVRPSSSNGTSGLVVFDIRQFRKINHRFGDESGDMILRAIASDLTAIAGPKDFLCRTGGSEFALLRRDANSIAAFESFARKVLKKICSVKVVEGQETVIDANAGVSFHKANTALSENILTDATLALRAAKQKGSKELEVFSPMMRAIFESNAETAKEVLSALEHGNIVPWYQPQVDINTGQIIGAEALARWIDGDQVRFPGAFLPAAEDAGYMELIETAVRENLLSLATTLETRDMHGIHLGLNVSASFLEQENVAEEIYAKIGSLGLKPSNFNLEILEAVMIDEIAAMPVKANIARLSELGFFIELDDFGTGHSSISSLRDLKVDRVKIDRSFVTGVDTNPGLQKFTSALINLAKSLDISVLAEGVETEGERLWLQQNGCDYIQGFLVSKAVPEEQILDMIQRQSVLNADGKMYAVTA